jgi:hypothetical protein
MKTAIVINKSLSPDTVDAGNGMLGYQVQLDVVSASGITPKIFIMQREVLSAGSPSEYEDQFYSVASVPQLESVPESPSDSLPFYRTNSITLIFPKLEDRTKYVGTILGLVEKLRAANDILLDTVVSEEVGFPPQSISRFWGFSADTSIPPSEILAAHSDSVPSREFSKVLATELGAYFFFAIRQTLGDIEAIRVQGNPATFVASTVTLQVLDGFSATYRLFRTSSQISPSDSILVEIE